MSDLPQFNQDQKDFVLRCLGEGVPVGKVTADVMEIYQDFHTENIAVRDSLYQRITKIKARMPQLEQKTEQDIEPTPVYFSAQWRITYFRELLRTAKDVPTKIRLLREIRAEVNIINTLADKTKQEANDKPESHQERWQRICDENPGLAAYEDAVANDWIHPTSVLPIKDYDVLEKDHLFRRKCDGVVVLGDGKPQTMGEKSHNEWLAEQEDYDYDPGFTQGYEAISNAASLPKKKG